MAQVHVIIGEDEYLVSEAATRIVGDGIGLETVDSANSSNAEAQLKDIREAEASLMTPPFLDPKKTTWWRNVGFLPFRWFTFAPGSFSDDYESQIEILDPFARSSTGYAYGWYGSACSELLYDYRFDDSLETWATIEPLKADSTYEGPPFEDD